MPGDFAPDDRERLRRLEGQVRALQAWRREAEPQLEGQIRADAIARGVAAELERRGSAQRAARFSRRELALGWAGIVLWLITIVQGAVGHGHW